ncbi:uncharacterized protein LOC130749912 [Actinidia eriantha]|uniref:uncharacterized protein LOC130749912 n=1 Tax=Actinidia eriantha TaxID=165200 RepID=UPI00258DD0BE|nr:uncharacterized protein LOC130749912 [Actinidia eriantha]
MEIKNEDFVKWPKKIKTNLFQRNKNKYYEFYKDHGHNTEKCFQLKEQITNLIKRGYLRKYVADRLMPDSLDIGYTDNKPTAGDIQTTHGGFGSGGCSNSSEIGMLERHGLGEEEVYNLSIPMSEALHPITFTNKDLRGLHLFHDDVLVISARIVNFNVQRIQFVHLGIWQDEDKAR